MADPANEFLSALVGETGRFSEGAYPGGLNQYKIMYGWPGVGTSYTTLDVDGVREIYGDAGLTSGPTDSGDTDTSSALIQGVDVTQTIKLVTNPDTGRVDTAAITYTLHNGDAASHNVGLRFMNDVDVNDNDGALFRLPNLGAVTTDQDLSGGAIPDAFTVYQDLADSQHIALARLIGAGATTPDRLVIAPWPTLFPSQWDYTATGADITGDSAYAAYWNPVPLAPGGSRVLTTYYGLSNVTVDLTPPLALGVSAPTNLTIEGSAYSPNPFTITATVSNVGGGVATGVNLALELPPDLHTSSPLVVNVGDLRPEDGERQATWSVTADPSSEPVTVDFTVTATAGNAPTKTLTRSVSRPGLTALIPTSTKANAALLTLDGPSVYLKLSGVLRAAATGESLFGRILYFYDPAGTLLCSAYTNAAGLASCKLGAGLSKAVIANSYRATYPGDTVYAPSTGWAKRFTP